MSKTLDNPEWDGARLASLRRELGYTQKAFGALLGIDEPNRQARMSNYECNKVRPSIETFCNMCRAAGCTAGQLLGTAPIEYEVES